MAFVEKYPGHVKWIKYANANGTPLTKEEREKQASLLYRMRFKQWKLQPTEEETTFENFPPNKKFADFARKYVKGQRRYKNYLFKDDVRRGALSGIPTGSVLILDPVIHPV